MHFTYVGLLIVAVAWFTAATVQFALGRRRMSGRMSLFLFVFATLSAAIAQYFVSTWMFDIERHSAAHLAGVARLRLEDDTALIVSVLARPLDEESDDRAEHLDDLDWDGTFRAKTDDILVTLDDVAANACIRRYYSVWASDIEFDRHQLHFVAQQVLKAKTAAIRQESLASYLTCLRNASRRLGDLAGEMRSRRPDEYYQID